MPARKSTTEQPGEQFGLWTIIREAEPDKDGRRQVECRCDCGTIRVLDRRLLKYGRSKSCGCLPLEHGAARKGKRTPEFRAWDSMLQRCYSQADKEYHNYGGRGIRVCDRWRDSFSNFFADMGPRPSTKHSVDRFPDRDGDYAPGNCRWATPTQQGRNRRNNRRITAGGLTLTLCEWAERLDCWPVTIAGRISRGWSEEEAVLTPINRKTRRTPIA